ncbi:hypothetical protein [Dolichospermum phage Dfl-JY23]
MTRLSFAQVSAEFKLMGYELRKENKGYSCEVINKFQNLQTAREWLNQQVSIAEVDDQEDTDCPVDENYLNDSGERPTFEEVETAIAQHGYELHRNNGQFFTESKAPYVYFKTGESEYAIHVTYFLDTIIESVTEIYTHKINNQRFQQVAYELSKTSDQSGENLTGNETLIERLSMLEKRLVNAVEQRRSNVRQICSDIGQMVRSWSSGQGFGATVKRVSRTVTRRAKRFCMMLVERVAPKYHIEHF